MIDRRNVVDRALPGLPAALDADVMSEKLRPLLESGPNGASGWRVIGVELVKHKPGKRCALAYTMDGCGRRSRLFAKTYRNHRGAGIFKKLTRFSLRQAGAYGVLVPKPVAYLPEIHMLVTEFVDGSSLAGPLYDGTSDTPAARMASTIAALHGCGVRCKGKWGPREELSNTQRWIAHVPRATERAEELLDRCRSELEGLPHHLEFPVHRDFYPEQVMDSDGATVLLDLDDACSGDPALDLGNFLAHLQLRHLQFPDSTLGCNRARRVFLEQYRRRWPAGIDAESLPKRIRFYEATSLLRLSGVYGQRERWAATVPSRLLDACDAALTRRRVTR